MVAVTLSIDNFRAVGLLLGIYSNPGTVLMKANYTLVMVAAAMLYATGCTTIGATILGINTNPEWHFPEEATAFQEKRDIPIAQYYLLDTVSYRAAIIQTAEASLQAAALPSGTVDSVELDRINDILKDDYQPVQMRFFDADGEGIYASLNCDLDPPIPMRWNVKGALDQFPPDQNKLPYGKDRTLRPMSYYLPHLRKADGSAVTREELPRADYYAVLMVNDIFRKPSKKLLKTVRNYLKRQDADVHVLYVNNHNSEIWVQMDDATKLMIKDAYNQSTTGSTTSSK